MNAATHKQSQEPLPDDSPASAKPYWKNKALIFILTAILVFVSRLPLLDAGYGVEVDSWRTANAARDIAATGKYTASRNPGHPVQESAYSLIWRGGPLALNGASALLCAIGAAFFTLSLRTLGFRYHILGGLALAFVPAVYISSVSSKDYAWALAFFLGSLHLVIGRRPIWAGILLGLAIGCRITYGLMLFPLGLMLIRRGAWLDDLKSAVKLALGAAIICALCYVPVVLRYGWGYFTVSEKGYPPVPEIIYAASVGVWGALGSLAIIIAAVVLIWQLVTSRDKPSAPEQDDNYHVYAWILAICLYGLAFIRLPYHPGYLIPAVPFVILLILRFTRQREGLALFVCVMLILSPFVMKPIRSDAPGLRLRFIPTGDIEATGSGYTLDILRGPIFHDHALRIHRMEFIKNVISAVDGINEKSVIVTGSWGPQIRNFVESDKQGMSVYVYLLTRAQFREYMDKGFKVRYLPDQHRLNMDVHGLDLRENGALPLNVDGR